MTYSNILLPIDLEEPGTQRKAFEVALHMSQNEGAKLHVMTVVPKSPSVRGYFPADFERKAGESAAADLKAFVDAEAPDAGDTIHRTVAIGSIHREILRCAEETKSDLIVMASHHPTVRDVLMSPHSIHIVTHARQSVLVVRE